MNIFQLFCLNSNALLETKGVSEDDSAPKSTVEKPPSTPKMSAHDAEDMANAMLWDSPLPVLRGAMKGSRRAVEVTSFKKKEVKSFLKRKATRSYLKKHLQVSL